jgi:bifunctional non-homologous end joining protein LigD
VTPLATRPMFATAGPPPIQYGDFAVEAKYDGQRGTAILQGCEVTLLSRNGAVITSTFPELADVPAGLGHDVVLDGEIVALDRFGRPSFTRL